jgi:hypothetical protein
VSSLLLPSLTCHQEDLIVMDGDLIRDYPLEEINLNLYIPSGYRIIEAKNIPQRSMPSLLLRAKIVLDLALPGPERISQEGILMGAIPIIAKRWNGVSEVDFPSIRKVDPSDSKEISAAIAEVARNYESELSRLRNSEFLSYVLVCLPASLPLCLSLIYG